MKKTLEIGDSIPKVQLKDQNDEEINLGNVKGAAVIYFYPKDNTPGCTAEACSFRDQFEAFESLGAQVFGISNDSVKSHEKFAARHQLNFTLLSDPQKKAERAFGVERTLLGLLPGRETFVFNNEGQLIKRFNSAIQATRHVKEAIKALEKQ